MALELPRFTPQDDPRPHDVAWPPMRWPVDPGTELVGSTVVLRPYDPADAPELYSALDDDRVWTHVAGRPGSPGELAEDLAERTGPDRLVWVVRLREPLAGLPAGVVVGRSSYLDASAPDARLEIGSTSYAFPVWGTSVNPQCKLLLLEHAFDELGAARVQLKTDVRNTRSQQAIARLGATYEGTLRRYQRRADGTVRDTVMFSITVDEWPQVRERLEHRLAGREA
jgi:RimJ/RimL family protein N-acetyltransferase